MDSEQTVAALLLQNEHLSQESDQAMVSIVTENLIARMESFINDCVKELTGNVSVFLCH